MTELNERKNLKKLFSKKTLGATLLACSAAFAVTGALFIQGNIAAADVGAGSESSFKMMTGGSIRLDKDAYGLRFAAEIGETAPAANEEYHMMIFPAAYISNYSLTAGSDFVAKLEGKTTIDMLDYYDKDCFVQRFGKPVTVARRLFLDYRNEKVRKYMTETIRRMVEDYGAEYIKFDYNQDMGVGTDVNALTAGEGLELISQAYLSWVDEIRLLFPNVIFENCSSGGMRLDYESLSRFHLSSTSDCTSYENYPYISANLPTAVLPRQAGIWCYPVAGLTSSEEISDDRIVVNVVNCLLGRMCLASDLSVLNETQRALMQEGISLYKKLNEVREKGVPYLPMGLFRRGDSLLVSGLKTQGELYLCVWNMEKKECVEIDLGDRVKTVEVLYPSARGVVASNVGSKVTIRFEKVRMATFLKAVRE